MPPPTHQEIAGVYSRVNEVHGDLSRAISGVSTELHTRMSTMEQRLSDKLDAINRDVATTAGHCKACLPVVLGDGQQKPIKDVIADNDRESRERDSKVDGRLIALEQRESTRTWIDKAILTALFSAVVAAFKWLPELISRLSG